jgi:hypothetical protein
MALSQNTSDKIMSSSLDRVIAIASILVSVPSAWLSYHYSTVSQDRQLKIEQIFKFESSSAQIVEAVGDFVAALNARSDLAEAKKRIAASTTNEIDASEHLHSLFPKVNDIEKYMDALAEFNKVSQSTSSAMDIKPWMESLDKMNGLRHKATKSVKESISL